MFAPFLSLSFSPSPSTRRSLGAAPALRHREANLLDLVSNHGLNYPTPVNLSYFWGFGSLAGFCLFLQLTTGIFLAMHYCSDATLAFASVEHIMRDVNGGWLLRYLHANGASAFFAVVYLHILRALLYRSFSFANAGVWLSGLAIFVVMMATAFIGYVLPWGQMSFWGATVITSFFSVVPLLGPELVQWIWGGFAVGAPTLSRFFSLHYLLPFVLTALVFLHFYFLHNAGSSNPFTLEHRETSAGFLPLYPFFLVKDLVGLFAFALLFGYFVFFEPNALGHSDNYIEANGMVTPEHIVPEWYFLPFYAILRSIPDKTLGILAMGASLAALGTLSSDSLALDRSRLLGAALGGDNPRASARRTLLHQGLVVLFAAVFVLLGFIGARPVEEPYLSVGLALTVAYFALLQLLLLANLVDSPRRLRVPGAAKAKASSRAAA